MQARGLDGPSDTGIHTSEIERQLIVEDSTEEERHDPKLLRAIAIKRNIDSTKSLVAAYNATTDKNERAVLLGWLLKYSRRREECLTPESVLEYSELAKIAYISKRDAEVLRKLIYGLCSLIRPGELHNENIAEALFGALTWIDPAVYDDAAQIMDLGLDLLLSLSSRPRLTKQNFFKHEAKFFSIHQALFLLQIIGRGYLLEEEIKEFRRVIAQKREEMKLSISHYSVSFHFDLIQQAVERLEIEDAPSRLVQAKRFAASGIYGGIHVLHFLRKLAGGDIDPLSIEDAYRKSRVAIANAGVFEREWYDILQILTAARIHALKEAKKCEIFRLAYDAAMEGQRKMSRANDQKALRFGIVQEMKLLASDEDSSYDGRKEATKKLVELATNEAIFENWIHDADILTEILDALYKTGTIDEQTRETDEALRKIQQSCDERAKGTLMIWLDGNTMEEKLKVRRQEHADAEHEDLFTKTGAAVGYLHPHTIHSNIKDLKETYLDDNFATVDASLTFFLIKHKSFLC